LVILAAVARACAEHFPEHYFEALTVASSLWLFGALAWGTFLLRLILRPHHRTQDVLRRPT
jgi:hypothetical protein